MELEIPLKEKYLVQRNHKGGSYKQRTGNSSGPTPKRAKNKQGLGIRRRAYNTHTH